MIILGLDPGTTDLGFGVIQKEEGKKPTALTWGSIYTKPKIPQQQKLVEIWEDLNNLTDKYKPNIVSIEKLFFFKNPKTVIDVAGVVGLCRLACGLRGIETVEFTPLQIKSILTGYGRADKKQIQEIVKRELGLEEIPKPDDAADGLAVAMCASFKLEPSQY